MVKPDPSPNHYLQPRSYVSHEVRLTLHYTNYTSWDHMLINTLSSNIIKEAQGIAAWYKLVPINHSKYQLRYRHQHIQ